MIKAVPDDFTYPKENVLKPTIPFDITIMAFEEACRQMSDATLIPNDILKPKDLIIGFDPDKEFIKYFKKKFKVNILLHNSGDVDEWWLTFENTDKIFYSPGV